MIKIPFIIIFFLMFFNNSFSKTLDVGLHKLEVPNNFYLKDVNQYEFSKDMCADFSYCYSIVPSKIKEILDQIEDGKDYNDIKILKPIILKINKLSRSSYKTAGRKLKNLFSTIRSTAKKNDSNYLFNYYFSNKNINETLELENYDTTIEEIRSMSKSELKKLTRDIKQEIFNGKSSYAITDELTLKIKAFDILKSLTGDPYLFMKGDVFYFYQQSHKLGNFSYYVSVIDKNIFVLDGYCLTACSKFDYIFTQIIDKSFNKKSLEIFNDANFIDQIEKLNELYKSGILTKEEFEKAKKRILN
jgi:hypothetical protein